MTKEELQKQFALAEKSVYLHGHNQRVIVSQLRPEQFATKHHQRGYCGAFSRFSRKRLQEMLYSFKKIPFRTFWTFTFEKDVPVVFAKKEINRLNMVFNRRHIGWMWVMEFTEKGRVHFHYGLDGYRDAKWMRARWHNGRVHVEEIYDDPGIRDYFLKEERATFYKEVSKKNQKRFMGFNGRWWGVSRHLNKKYSIGVYSIDLAVDLKKTVGLKHNYYRDDFEKLGVDLEAKQFDPPDPKKILDIGIQKNIVFEKFGTEEFSNG